MIDLHYMRNIVLNVEVGQQEESQKTRAQPHQRTRRSEEGFHLAVFAFSLSTKLNVLGADRLMFS